TADSIPACPPRADLPALCRRRLPETAERDLIGAWPLPASSWLMLLACGGVRCAPRYLSSFHLSASGFARVSGLPYRPMPQTRRQRRRLAQQHPARDDRLRRRAAGWAAERIPGRPLLFARPRSPWFAAV